MGIDKNKYLDNVLKTYKMSHIDDKVNKYKQRRDEVENALQDEYRSSAYAVFNSGSFAKHTAINTKFDMDIVIPFKHNSFRTLEDMYNGIHNFLASKFGTVATIRKQKVSIGVKFNIDSDGDCIDIDVVPGRELGDNDFPATKNLNLYFNDDHWGFSKGTLTKTNIQSQIDHIHNRVNERSVIRLLKIWKNCNNVDCKSFMFELITIKAFDKNGISGNIWDMLRQVIEYIRENIQKDNFTLIDPGNSGNDLMKKMDVSQKNNIAVKMNNILNSIESYDEYIKSFFPVNETFDTDKSQSNSYGVKNVAATYSTPPNNERFG